MALITLDELLRGACIGVFGGAAGACTLAFPGSALWLVPAAAAVGGAALTVPEIRQEVTRALPALQEARKALPAAAWRLPGIKAPEGAAQRQRAPGAATAPDARPELLRTLDDQPHRLIIGHTRGGKTTLIHEMATGWAAAGERVLVADPDAAPGLWPGCEVRGYGDDIQSIGEIFGIVAAEVEARRLARAQGVRQFAPIHLVVDEAQDVLPALDGGMELFEDIARRGGKLNVRLTVGVQDKQVKTLGLEGKSALLRNFQVADVMKNREGRRVAVLRDPETGAKTSLPIPDLPDPERLIVRRSATGTTQDLTRPGAPAVPVHVPASQDALLAALLGDAIPSHQDAGECPVNPVPRNRINDTGTCAVTVDGGSDGGGPVTVNVVQVAPGRSGGRKADSAYERALVEVYRALGAEGLTFAKAYAQHRGTKEIVFTAWQEGRNSRGKEGPQ